MTSHVQTSSGFLQVELISGLDADVLLGLVSGVKSGGTELREVLPGFLQVMPLVLRHRRALYNNT